LTTFTTSTTFTTAVISCISTAFVQVWLEAMHGMDPNIAGLAALNDFLSVYMYA
jgi:hypothetical protein